MAERSGETPIKGWIRALEKTALLRGDADITLPALMDDLAVQYGDRPALISEDEAVTYAELGRRANQYAGWARDQGLRAGETVCLMMHNCPDYVAIWLGVTRTGAVVALLNTNLTGVGLAHSIAIAAPAHIIASAEFAGRIHAIDTGLASKPRLWRCGGSGPDAVSWLALERADYSTARLGDAQTPPVPMRSVALHIYTSGTTGLPKAVNVSHYRIMEWSFWFAGMMDTGPGDRLYDCLPMYHSTGGVVAVGAMLVNGGAVVIRRRFSASRFWEDVADEGCTMFLYIGELCRYLLAAPHHPRETEHRLRLCFGNGLRADVWEAFERRFGIARIIEFYAATEGNVALYNCEGRPGAVGRVPPVLAHRFPVTLIRCDSVSGEPLRDQDGFCMRCTAHETGEAVGKIVAGGADASRSFEGYTDRSASERKILRNVFAANDVWFRTGDLMRRDAAGFFYFVDRIGDTFRWKGENVSTSEVAEILLAYPGVVEAVVYGVEIPSTDGRAGMAAITAGARFDIAGLHAHLAERLPVYARILFLRVCATLDMTGTFKPVKANLVHEGFGPAAEPDALYFNDMSKQAFVPLTADLRERILSGGVRF